MRERLFILVCFTALLLPGLLLSQSLQVSAGNDTTIYYGYGPGTANLSAAATGGSPPYLFVWSSGDSTQSVTVSPVQTTTYTVTVYDSLNNSASDSVKVTVVDVRCGPRNEKVMVCHNGFVICVDEHAVPAHLAHGDVLGNCIVTGTNPENTPVNFRFYNNYPNPFNPVTTFRFDLPKAVDVKLEIFDVSGRVAAVIVNEKMNAGSYYIDWNAGNRPTGVYFCRFKAGDFSDIRKLVLVK